MSDTSEITNGCLTHYDSRHIQVRADFMGICQYNREEYKDRRKKEPNQECMAKILRLLETLTDHSAAEWKLKTLKAEEKGLAKPKEPDRYPIELSNGVLVRLMYNTFGESTVRNSLSYLLEIGYIGYSQEKKNDRPHIWLEQERIQAHLKLQAQVILAGYEFRPPHYQGLKSYPSDAISNPRTPISYPAPPKSDPPGCESTDNNISNIDDITYEKDKEEGTFATSLQEDRTPAQFAFQVQNFPLHFYHDFCIHEQDRGINDGLTLIVKNLADVPHDAECQICYKPVHGPHGYRAPIDFTEQKKKRTDPQLPAVKGQDNDRRHPGSPAYSMADLSRNERPVEASLSEEADTAQGRILDDEDDGDFDTDAFERSVIEGSDDEPTQKMPVVHKTSTSEQKPVASVSLSLVADSPVGRQDAQRGGRQAILTLAVPITPAAPSGVSLPGNSPARPEARQGRNVIPRRPLRKVIEKPQLTFAGQQVREWYEQVRECKVRMTDKNVITLNRLADIDEMTQENLKDVLDLYDTDKWMIEHNVTVDLQELEKQDGKFTFERGLLAVKRKRRAPAPTQNGKAPAGPDQYGNDYSLKALQERQERQQKAM